ncbi:MAG: hypothetical protein AAF634_08980, partial [Bacteroidota bacterium]
TRFLKSSKFSLFKAEINKALSPILANQVFFHSFNKENLEDFRKRVYHEVRDIHVTRFPYNNFLYPEHLDQF